MDTGLVNLGLPIHLHPAGGAGPGVSVTLYRIPEQRPLLPSLVIAAVVRRVVLPAILAMGL